jgi:hypothetical protein
MPDERDEKIERLARKRHRLAVRQKQTFTGDQHKASEAKSRLLAEFHCWTQAIRRRNPGDSQGRPQE